MTSSGKVMLSTGTAWVIMSVVDADTTASVPEWVNLYFHAVPGKRLGGQLVGGFGATVDWWLNQVFGKGTNQKDVYDQLNDEVRSSPAGSRGLLFLSLSGTIPDHERKTRRWFCRNGTCSYSGGHVPRNP